MDEKEKIIHVKVPRELHLSVKLSAFQAGLTMNDYVGKQLQEATSRITTANVVRTASLGTDTFVADGTNPVKKIKKPKTINQWGAEVINIPFKRAANGLCKIHGTPLTDNGKCLQKGCKYN